MTNPKPPTPQGISALLRKAGFEKSVSSASRIKGWRNHSPGYIVRADSPGRVFVHHTTSDFRPSRERCAEEQERYAQAIEAAGYAVERGEGGLWGPLIVTAPKEAGE